MKTILKSSQITLRPSTFDDCKYFTIWESKEHIRRFFTMNDTRDYEEITKEFIIRDTDPTLFQFTIINNTTSEAIGRIYLSKYDQHEDSIDITRIYIGEDAFLRKGFGRESLEILLNYFFNTLNLERVTIDFFEDNTTAKNLYTSLGFKSEGVLRHVAKKNNTYINLHLMSILKDEYFSNL